MLLKTKLNIKLHTHHPWFSTLLKPPGATQPVPPAWPGVFALLAAPVGRSAAAAWRLSGELRLFLVRSLSLYCFFSKMAFSCPVHDLFFSKWFPQWLLNPRIWKPKRPEWECHQPRSTWHRSSFLDRTSKKLGFPHLSIKPAKFQTIQNNIFQSSIHHPEGQALQKNNFERNLFFLVKEKPQKADPTSGAVVAYWASKRAWHWPSEPTRSSPPGPAGARWERGTKAPVVLNEKTTGTKHQSLLFLKLTKKRGTPPEPRSFC